MPEPETIFVRPAGATPVRKPGERRAFLATEGESVPRDSYWLRRLADGDVIAAETAPAKSTAPKKN